MSKYIIIDNTSNTGKDYIDDNGHNCIEEQAAKYNSRAEAERVAQSLTKGQVERWEEWASIAELDDRQDEQILRSGKVEA